MRRRVVVAFPVVAIPLALACASTAVAMTYVVKPDGTGDFPTIQDAVDAATDGDEILLANGTFIGTGNHEVDFSGKAITIRSQSGNPELCTIDLDPVHFGPVRGFLFESGEQSSSVLEAVRIINGFYSSFNEGAAATVRNGSAPRFRNVRIENTAVGAGVFVEGGGVDLEGCVIQDNSTIGVAVSGGTATLTDCAIRNNSASAVGVWYGAATLTGCTIEANTTLGSGGGGIHSLWSQLTLESCRINRNSSAGSDSRGGGGGVYAWGGSLSATDCQFVENTSTERAGGLLLGSGVTVSLTRVTVAGNRALTGGGIHGTWCSGTFDSSTLWGNCTASDGPDAVLESAATLTATCSDVDPAQVSGTGTLTMGAGSVTLDPLFCQPRLCSDALGVLGVYDLQEVSPLIGLAGCGTPGFPSVPCLISVQPTSWGKIKAGYR